MTVTQYLSYVGQTGQVLSSSGGLGGVVTGTQVLWCMLYQVPHTFQLHRYFAYSRYSCAVIYIMPATFKAPGGCPVKDVKNLDSWYLKYEWLSRY